MPGPKIVKDFEFPSSFGFSGSASDSPRINVRPHERARPKQRYAEGGLVDRAKKFFGMDTNKSDGDKDAQVAKADPTPQPKAPPRDTIAAPPTSGPADAIKNQTDRKMKELGLKRGGKVSKTKFKKGGKLPRPKYGSQAGDYPAASSDPGLKRGGKVKKGLGGFLKKIVKSKVLNPVGAIAGSKAGKVLDPVGHAVQAKVAPPSRPAVRPATPQTLPGRAVAAQNPAMDPGGALASIGRNIGAMPMNPMMMRSKGGKVSKTKFKSGGVAKTKFNSGGPVKAKDGGRMRKIAQQEVSKHVNYPAPKGHKGLKNC